MDFEKYIGAAVEKFPSGVFLVTGEEANPMTIGWGSFGVTWGRPTLCVMVRESRYSHKLIESGRFTVSVPAPGAMKAELGVCGSKSGRDTDKKAVAGLKLLPARTEGGVPGIAGCALHFECKVMLKSPVDYADLPEDLKERFYANGDPHDLYFGEILAAYEE